MLFRMFYQSHISNYVISQKFQRAGSSQSGIQLPDGTGSQISRVSKGLFAFLNQLLVEFLKILFLHVNLSPDLQSGRNFQFQISGFQF